MSGSDVRTTSSPVAARRHHPLVLLMRSFETGQANALLFIAAILHVGVGSMAIVVPGSVSSGAVNAALLAGLVAGGATCYAVAAPTPWYAWGSRWSPAAFTAVPLAATLLSVLALGTLVEALTGRRAVAGWCASAGLALIVLAVIGRATGAALTTCAVGIALVVLVPQEAPGVVAGLSGVTWYDPAPPLGSQVTPWVLLAAGVAASLLRVHASRRTYAT